MGTAGAPGHAVTSAASFARAALISASAAASDSSRGRSNPEPRGRSSSARLTSPARAIGIAAPRLPGRRARRRNRRRRASPPSPSPPPGRRVRARRAREARESPPPPSSLSAHRRARGRQRPQFARASLELVMSVSVLAEGIASVSRVPGWHPGRHPGGHPFGTAPVRTLRAGPVSIRRESSPRRRRDLGRSQTVGRDDVPLRVGMNQHFCQRFGPSMHRRCGRRPRAAVRRFPSETRSGGRFFVERRLRRVRDVRGG